MLYFPTGTKTYFCQTSAPTGWTKDTTFNDATIRIVTTLGGGGGSGGTENFATAMATGTWAGSLSITAGSGPSTTAPTVLASTQIPAHSHNYISYDPSQVFPTAFPVSNPVAPGTVTNVAQVAGFTNPLGGSGHTHTINYPGSGTTFTGGSYNFNVNYVDLIIATAT